MCEVRLRLSAKFFEAPEVTVIRFMLKNHVLAKLPISPKAQHY